MNFHTMLDSKKPPDSLCPCRVLQQGGCVEPQCFSVGATQHSSPWASADSALQRITSRLYESIVENGGLFSCEFLL